MDADIIQVVDAVSTAKDVEREIIFDAIESAIASATKKKYAEDIDVNVRIDRQTGHYKTYRSCLLYTSPSPRDS